MRMRLCLSTRLPLAARKFRLGRLAHGTQVKLVDLDGERILAEGKLPLMLLVEHLDSTLE